MPIVVSTWTMSLSFYCATWRHYTSIMKAKLSKTMINQIHQRYVSLIFLRRLPLPRKCFIHRSVQNFRKSHLWNEASTQKMICSIGLVLAVTLLRGGGWRSVIFHIRLAKLRTAKRGMLNKDSKTLLPLNLTQKSLNGASFILTHNYKNVIE